MFDGTLIDLSDIYEISEIRDYGEDDNTIDESTLSFTIRLKNGKSIHISKNYHYNDWFEMYKELKKIRQDISNKWNQSKSVTI